MNPSQSQCMESHFPSKKQTIYCFFAPSGHSRMRANSLNPVRFCIEIDIVPLWLGR